MFHPSPKQRQQNPTFRPTNRHQPFTFSPSTYSTHQQTNRSPPPPPPPPAQPPAPPPMPPSPRKQEEPSGKSSRIGGMFDAGFGAGLPGYDRIDGNCPGNALPTPVLQASAISSCATECESHGNQCAGFSVRGNTCVMKATDCLDPQSSDWKFYRRLEITNKGKPSTTTLSPQQVKSLEVPSKVVEAIGDNFPIDPSAYFHALPGDCPGPAIDEMAGESASACAAACLSDRRCGGFSWALNVPPRRCRLRYVTCDRPIANGVFKFFAKSKNIKKTKH